jgi:hypothetical protein
MDVSGEGLWLLVMAGKVAPCHYLRPTLNRRLWTDERPLSYSTESLQRVTPLSRSAESLLLEIADP